MFVQKLRPSKSKLSILVTAMAGCATSRNNTMNANIKTLTQAIGDVSSKSMIAVYGGGGRGQVVSAKEVR